MKKKRIIACLLAGVLTLQSTAVLYASPEESQAAAQETSRTQERQNARAASSQESREAAASVPEITNAAEIISLPELERVEIIGEMCRQDYAKSGILASVGAAQCILESGYLGTDLAQEANNCFGMKATLSGNDWEGSAWDGKSTYTKQTGEEYNGRHVTVTAAFRKYDSVADSVADHSAYLLGATDGDGLRYPGLKGETDYRKAIQIIKDGGYATDSRYVSKICSIIERFDLTRYDTGVETKSNDELLENVHFYRIRKSWEDEDSQLGAFLDLDLAKKNCKKGYFVYDWEGKAVYQK